MTQEDIVLTLRDKKDEFEIKTPHFADEREGWKGYIEWENYPEKKKEAAAILAKYEFDHVGSS
jgi:hypothetical protein